MVAVWWDGYSVTRTTAVFPLVRCDHCGKEYIYYLEVSAESTQWTLYSWDDRGAYDRASKDSERKLAEQARTQFLVVSCPKCRKFQPYMVRPAAMLAYGPPIAKLVLICGTGVCIGFGSFVILSLLPGWLPVATLVLVASISIPVALSVIYAILASSRARNFDPNSMPLPPRIAQLVDVGVPKEEFLAKVERDNAERWKRYSQGHADPEEDLSFLGRFLVDVWFEPEEISRTPVYRRKFPGNLELSLELRLSRADNGVLDFEDHAISGLPQFSARIHVFTSEPRPKRYRAATSDA